jgi:hypothetical protein
MGDSPGARRARRLVCFDLDARTRDDIGAAAARDVNDNVPLIASVA